MTIQEIESAYDAGQSLDFSRHAIEAPELFLTQTFYPLGFNTVVRTNSEEVMSLFGDAWGMFAKKFDEAPLRVDVHVTSADGIECPPTPMYKLMRPVLVCVADGNNYSVVDIEKGTTQIAVTTAALRHPLYLRWFFLDAAAACHIATRYATPIHAGCVALNGNGVLLCGDSGAGKSSLSFACAKAGFTYISDDCSFLLNSCHCRTVTGDCHRVRLRPAAAGLFPEIGKLRMTSRVAGKPSVELTTASMPELVCASSVEIKQIIFLNRRGDSHELRPYRKEVARYAFRQTLYGSTETLAKQYQVVERLLELDVQELCYNDMGWAIRRLDRLLREGL